MSSRKVNSSEDEENRNAKIAYDEKKRKRMISNRESARRSRTKKEHHFKDLSDQVAYFRTRSDETLRKINEIGPRCMAVELENRILRMQCEEMNMRLKSLQQVLVSRNISSSTSNYVSVCDDVGNTTTTTNDDTVDDYHEFNVMDILQEPWLQHGFDQSQTVDGIYQF
ncbi:hypothetical protein OROGR_008623 [Orobanche gracilis]